MSFTFKKRPAATGLASVAERTRTTEIKHKGALVGLIEVPCMFEDNTRIRFMVKCEEHPGWKWMTIKAGFEDETAARATLKAKYQYIIDKFDLNHQEDD